MVESFRYLKMAQQQTQNDKPEVDFLEGIQHKLMLTAESKDWSIQAEYLDSYVTLTIDSSNRFSQNCIELIVKTISDDELFKFDILRKLGWCSA